MYTYYYTYHTRFNFYNGRYGTDFLYFELYMDKRFSPMQNWLDSITKYV